MLVARFVSTLLGVAVCLPLSALEVDAAQKKPAATRHT